VVLFSGHWRVGEQKGGADLKSGGFSKNVFCFLVIVFVMWGTAVLAAELRVPFQYPCIQDAIKAAVPV
jgi:hypothetical protein